MFNDILYKRKVYIFKSCFYKVDLKKFIKKINFNKFFVKINYSFQKTMFFIKYNLFSSIFRFFKRIYINSFVKMENFIQGFELF